MDALHHHHYVGLAAVTVAAVLEQAYFSLQVISARRKFGVSPPCTSGHPQFERVFRAQVNCSEYFPIFIAILWTSGVFFSSGDVSNVLEARSSCAEVPVRPCSPGASCVCGVAYVLARLLYFQGYAESPQQRLRALYVSAGLLWLLIGFSCVGVLASFWRLAVHHFLNSAV
ncbi:leukotriene C4 synthase isoform X1 [Syngnathus scovelli]|uniref:leukotriene C4 synthase isoform X1 n=1 Tax=Syngnathus scovelli TaxID=161590 RepID=UPI00210F5D96|nr:leukotriene C4 synthase isoform X1 [Syngnathus scovelli]